MSELYDDYYDDDPEPCDHDQYANIDILTGRALCLSCGHAWWLTAEQLREEIAWQAGRYEEIAAAGIETGEGK